MFILKIFLKTLWSAGQRSVFVKYFAHAPTAAVPDFLKMFVSVPSGRIHCWCVTNTTLTSEIYVYVYMCQSSTNVLTLSSLLSHTRSSDITCNRPGVPVVDSLGCSCVCPRLERVSCQSPRPRRTKSVNCSVNQRTTTTTPPPPTPRT